MLGGGLMALFIGCTPAPGGEGTPDPGGSGGNKASGGSGGSKASGGSGGGATGGGSGSTGGSTGSTGGSSGSTGGSTGSNGGSSGTTGGSTGSNGGAGGSATGGSGAGGAGGATDAGVPSTTPEAGAGETGTVTPSAPGQGPVAEGKVVFSQDFEQNMNGMTRSPNGLPEDRAMIVDDPLKARGKVVRIHWQQGDNFRTSPGTEPRSWFSSAQGYTVRPGTVVSVAWGFMWENANMGAHFAQIIRDGGPLWMFGVDQGGNGRAAVHRGSGASRTFKIEPMKWYDFRVDTDYKGGGEIKFYVNNELVGTGRGDGGAPARFDCGIYWMKNGRSTRTVYVSNVSIGEK